MPASVVAIFKDSGNARLCCCDIQGQRSAVVMPASVVAIFKDSGNARLCCCDIQGQW